ncbi:MAG: alpha/beta hydrolase [Acidobacteria bacterium]|nr:alpha/beta hydrolase [Acidobacteriota bacterium]
MSSPIFVLVHGGWAGAWCWRDLTRVLDARGATWRALDLPSSQVGTSATTDLRDDASSVVEVTRGAGPVLLVGHSYGGSVITEAAPDIEDLRGLIYVAALLPQRGESSTDASRAAKARTRLDEAIYVDGEILRLRPDIARDALYNDCDAELAQWALDHLSTQTLASFRSVRTSVDLDVRTRYITCSEDRAIDPATQSIMADRCDDVTVLSSGHSPFLSQPVALADALLNSFE